MPPTPAAVSLCLACSASLPPQKANAQVYRTQCCSRPICPSCISSNPRLARYNPCLRCLAGVHAVKTRPSVDSSAQQHNHNVNVDGSVRDEDIFVVEDEDEEDSQSDADSPSEAQDVHTDNAESVTDETQRPPSTSASPSAGPSVDTSRSSPSRESGETAPASGLPPKYFIRPDDTLVGISLKLGVDGRILCRLNNLPVSTLRTTPHLLHTRAFLTLPPSVSAPPPLSPAEQAADEERQARLARERAETRFQAMTKEADRSVAKAYVALAGLPDGETGEVKEYDKERGLRKRRVRAGETDGGEGSLEGEAMDRYFDDEEWEARERAEGRKAALPPFPYIAAAGPSRPSGSAPAEGEKSWWRWKS